MIDAVVCARMGAGRLPNKPLLEAGGRTMLEHAVARIRAAVSVRRLVVATSDLSVDNPIAEVSEQCGAECFRGSPDDVLDRIRACAVVNDMEHVGIFGADNPILDPAVIDQVAGAYLADSRRWDYVTNNYPQTFPDGQEVEILSAEALETAAREASSQRERAHVLTFLWDRPERFSIRNITHEPNLAHERWTLDFAEDYELLRTVIETLEPENALFGMDRVLALLDRRPELRSINERHRDRYEWLGRARSADLLDRA